MENSLISQPSRMHPLMVGAAVSVILVSLVGVAAITGVIPSSHGSSVPANPALGLVDQSNPNGTSTRYVTSDGKVFEEIPGARNAVPVQRVQSVATAPVYKPTAAVHHHHQQNYAQNSYSEPTNTYQQRTYQQPNYVPQQHPVVNYVNDMHPVGTGVGAVLGGVLGNQIGGGNGKKLATVAGVLMGGYAGNEVAHNRSPLPGQ